MSSSTTGTPLNIGIIGAGISGLSAAIALRRSGAGHTIELFERSSFSHETGAAIHTCPNATRILNSWGFDFARARAVPNERFRTSNAETLEVSSCAEYADAWDTKWYMLHRVDLHRELRRLAEEAGARIRLGAEVSAETDVEEGVVVLRNGEKIRKDVVIAADGVHSIFVSKVINAPPPPLHTGRNIFRFLLPTDALLSSPQTQHLFALQGSLNLAHHPDRHIFMYPCRSNTLQNFGAIYPDPAPAASLSSQDWYVPETPTSKSIDDLLAAFPDTHPTLRFFFSQAQDLKHYPLLARDPLPTWHSGRTILIGDSAHPMLPLRGQGAAQALEDSVALGTLLSHLPPSPTAADIERRFKLVEKIRIGRAGAIQLLSSVYQEEVERVVPKLEAFFGKGKVPVGNAEIARWNFGYDVRRECEAVLERFLKGDEGEGGKDGGDTCRYGLV